MHSTNSQWPSNGNKTIVLHDLMLTLCSLIMAVGRIVSDERQAATQFVLLLQGDTYANDVISQKEERDKLVWENTRLQQQADGLKSRFDTNLTAPDLLLLAKRMHQTAEVCSYNQRTWLAGPSHGLSPQQCKRLSHASRFLSPASDSHRAMEPQACFKAMMCSFLVCASQSGLLQSSCSSST